MKCMSVTSWGILIGATIIFTLSLITIFILRSFYDFSTLTPEEKESRIVFREVQRPLFYKILPFATLNIIMTALLVAGIVKKQHLLMKPWLYFTIGCIFSECLIIVLGSYNELLLLFVIILVIQLFLFLFMFILYDDIRNANLQSERIAFHVDQKNTHSCGNPNYV